MSLFRRIWHIGNPDAEATGRSVLDAAVTFGTQKPTIFHLTG